MDYNTLLVDDIPQGISVTLNRIEKRNTLNSELEKELYELLEKVEKNPDCKMIVLKGQQGIFCTGMDFQETASQTIGGGNFSAHYQSLLKRFTSMPKIIISLVDGQVMAGGVGLVAASDIVIATSRSQFTLSEALWGLLPANVMPYLIRRIGFQKAYFMTLTTQAISAVDAHAWHLVDELTDEAEDVLRKYSLRLLRLNEQTIGDLKNYFRKMWIINDEMEHIAIQELSRLMQEPRIQNNIKSYVEQQKFPWET
jgi:polyketide biosynthesis enoyl-CoA hydratase PksH